MITRLFQEMASLRDRVAVLEAAQTGARAGEPTLQEKLDKYGVEITVPKLARIINVTDASFYAFLHKHYIEGKSGSYRVREEWRGKGIFRLRAKGAVSSSTVLYISTALATQLVQHYWAERGDMLGAAAKAVMADGIGAAA